MKLRVYLIAVTVGLVTVASVKRAHAQMRDTLEKISGNAVNEGIHKNIGGQIGAGRGNNLTQNSSIYIIQRDPFRAIRRGRQLFQRKFLPTQGFNGRDRSGNIAIDASVGAGIVDSCAGCHGRPRGSAGHGGDVFTRPDSRDAPHLFGLGLQEMLGDEITADLRGIRARGAGGGPVSGTAQTRTLTSKGINYGSITANPNGTFVTTSVVGVNPDLRVRPFFAQGGTISIREFAVGAFNAEMGLQSDDPDLRNASINRQRVVTPAGMVLDGTIDAIEGPPVTGNNGLDPDGDGDRQRDAGEPGRLHGVLPAQLLQAGGQRVAGSGQRGELWPDDLHERRLRELPHRDPDDQHGSPGRRRRHGLRRLRWASPTTSGNPLNRLFATATPKIVTVDDPSPEPVLKQPARQAFVVNNFFADLKRHDLGNNFAERNFDGTFQRQFMTEPLWGVATTAPYGHDGRTQTLEEVILRHGGEAQAARDGFNGQSRANKNLVLAFLSSLVLFSPDDTASNTANINPAATNFPQNGHGAIALTPLFNNPADIE